MPEIKDTLRAQFEALQAEHERSWTPVQLEGNARQRCLLRGRFDPAAVAQVGEILPPHDLAQANGDPSSLDTLTANARRC